MWNEIVMKSILTIAGLITTGIMGYLIARVKEYKALKEGLKCLLRSNITSKYYVYKELGEIPHYEKENMLLMYEQYKKMGGNSFIDDIMEEIKDLPIKK